MLFFRGFQLLLCKENLLSSPKWESNVTQNLGSLTKAEQHCTVFVHIDSIVLRLSSFQYDHLYHAIENTDSQNTEKTLYTRRPSNRALRTISRRI